MKTKNIIIVGGWLIAFAALFFIISKNNARANSGYPVTGNSKMQTQTNNTTNTNTNSMDTTQLKIEDEVVGGGEEAKAGDMVTVQYVGTLTNGTVFDASRNHGDQGFSFPLGQGRVIKGWDMGVAGMKVGGKRKLTIPSDLAYGNQAVGGVIPANSTLIFEVELIKISR